MKTWMWMIAALALAGGALAKPVETYGMVFVCDGAKGDIFYDVALNKFHGKDVLPNVRKYFIEKGAWVRNTTTVFPTITGAGMPAVLTGCFPGRHNLPSLYFFDRVRKQYPVLYTPLEALDWDSWLSPNVKTIWEHFEGPDDALSFGPALHRGADEHVSILFNLKYKPMELRGKLKLARRKAQRALMGGLPARMTVVYNGWFDHMEHGLGARAPEMTEHYEAVDAQIGEAIAEFEEVMADRAKAGVDVRYFVALTSDHGHQDIKDVQSIDKFIKDQQGATIVDKVWKVVFGQKLSGTVNMQDLLTKDLLCAAGEGHALLYFPVIRNGQRIWEERPSIQYLRNFQFKGKVLDIPKIAVERDAVSFVTIKDHASGAVWIFAKGGESTIERKTENGRTTYRYKVQSGTDPLKYADSPAKALMDDRFHDGREWQLATVETEAPDGVVQLYQIFDSERSADIFLSAAPFVSIGDLVDGEKSKSKHGGMTRDECWATLAFYGSHIPKMEVHTARNVDCVPTMLALMDKSFDPTMLDGEPVPELMARVREERGKGNPALSEAATKALEEHMNALAGRRDDELAGWAAGFQALTTRPGVPAAKVREMRERAHRELSSRKDSMAQKLVDGEVASEFLARRRPDLNLRLGANETAISKVIAQEVADAAIKRVMDVMQKNFELSTDPSSAAGQAAQQEVHQHLAVVKALRQAGLLDVTPRFNYGTWRDGVNLKYDGLQPGPQDEQSQNALRDFISDEHGRAHGWFRGWFFDYERAKLQNLIGQQLAATSAALSMPVSGTSSVDLAALLAQLPAGDTRAAASVLVGVSATPAAPVAPPATVAQPAATPFSAAGAAAAGASSGSRGATPAPDRRSVLDDAAP